VEGVAVVDFCKALVGGGGVDGVDCLSVGEEESTRTYSSSMANFLDVVGSDVA